MYPNSDAVGENAGEECWSNAAALCKDNGQAPCEWCGGPEWFCCSATQSYPSLDNCGNVQFFSTERSHRCARKKDSALYSLTDAMRMCKETSTCTAVTCGKPHSSFEVLGTTKVCHKQSSAMTYWDQRNHAVPGAAQLNAKCRARDRAGLLLACQNICTSTPDCEGIAVSSDVHWDQGDCLCVIYRGSDCSNPATDNNNYEGYRIVRTRVPTPGTSVHCASPRI